MKVTIFFMLTTVILAIKTPKDEDYYLAAVVEYNPLDGNDTLRINAEEYVSIIQEAAPKADIIVFPEVGLLLYDKYKTFIPVPFGNDTVAPADDEHAHFVLKMISLEARKQNIYVVINVHEEDKSQNQTLHYNTNVIFNRTGNIIARYRKYNLFDEPLNVTKTPEQVFIDADFGVRFGTFTCFDILFDKPALSLIRENNVTDILYPTFWYSGLPYYTAVQTQAGWAYATDTNFLASGGNQVSGSNTGSGVYAGKRGPVVYLQSQRNETTILFAKLYKKNRQGSSSGTVKPIRYGQPGHLNIWERPVDEMVHSFFINPLNSSDSDKETTVKGDIYYKMALSKDVCHGSFCCSFNISVSMVYKPVSKGLVSLNPYMYRLVAFDGISSFYVRQAGVQLCSVVSCLNSSLESCGKPLYSSHDSLHQSFGAHFSNYSLYSTKFNYVKITTNTLDKNVFLFPSLLELSYDPKVYGSLMNVSQFSFSSEETTGSLKFTSEKLITGGIFGRVFSRDDPKSSSGVISPIILLLLILPIFYIFH